MRNYKFRAWDKQRNRMSKPFKLGDEFLEWEDGIDFSMPLSFFLSKERGMIMQSTEITTALRPNKLIFEGDIVKAGAFIGIVVYSFGAYFIDNKTLDEIAPLHESCMLLAGDIRILGNIYEHPELAP